ncbi:MAG: HNH endonuclease signature motif containing protein [Planctomycetota bacterium]|jgi:5-methylcytosine-specific restriction endonuclease McrA
MPTRPPVHGQRPRREYDAEYNRTTRKLDPRRRAAAQVHESRRWRKVRKMTLARDPICEPCAAEGRTNATRLQVHHLQHPFDAPALAYSLENLMTTCAGCHTRIHNRERGRR